VRVLGEIWASFGEFFWESYATASFGDDDFYVKYPTASCLGENLGEFGRVLGELWRVVHLLKTRHLLQTDTY